MPRTPLPSKPLEEKQRLGTVRKSRLAGSQLTVVPQITLEPLELPPAQTMATVLEVAITWLASTDAVSLSLLRETLEEREELRNLVMVGASRESRRDLRDLDKQIVAQLSMLGLDPTSRARLGLAVVKTSEGLE